MNRSETLSREAAVKAIERSLLLHLRGEIAAAEFLQAAMHLAMRGLKDRREPEWPPLKYSVGGSAIPRGFKAVNLNRRMV